MKKVKKITRYRRIVDDNDKLLNEYKSSYQEFDKNNNTIKEVDYTQSGDIETASGFKYDEQNRLVEEIHYFDEEEVGEVIRYKYNDEGKTSEIETTYADGSISLKKVSRTENIISVKAYDEDGEMDGEEIVKYNTDGNVVEEISLDEDKTVFDRKVYTYNDKNQLASKTTFGQKEEFMQKMVFEYDLNGNVSRETQLNRKDKPVRQVVYIHNSDNKMVEWENLQYIQHMKYDEEGKLIYEETRNRNNNMVESFTEYKFGENGLLAETRSFEMGAQYQLEPGVYARGKLTFIINRHDYEFFD